MGGIFDRLFGFQDGTTRVFGIMFMCLFILYCLFIRFGGMLPLDQALSQCTSIHNLPGTPVPWKI